VDDSRSIDAAAGPGGVLRTVRALRRHERLAALALLVSIGGFALPWYRADFPQSYSQTGVEAFGFAAAALLITVSAALLLIVQSGRGRHPPLPLHEGTLLAVAGIWSALIVGFLMLDRPPLDLGGFTTDYGLGFGLFVELGAAAVLAVAGMRLRRLELRRPRGAPRSPAAAFPARSPR
jgi:hypothetical protein